MHISYGIAAKHEHLMVTYTSTRSGIASNLKVGHSLARYNMDTSKYHSSVIPVTAYCSVNAVGFILDLYCSGTDGPKYLAKSIPAYYRATIRV